MLDTKLKNMRKLKNSIIILCALIPALILVALYPKMEAAMIKQQKEWQKEMEENRPSENTIWLQGNFINYAVEASYYIYGQLLQEKLNSAVDFSVLNEYGWINDYYYVNDQTFYYAELSDVTGPLIKKNTEKDISSLLDDSSGKLPVNMKKDGIKGYLVLDYDAYGQLADIRYAFDDDINYNNGFYREASSSMEQYLINGQYYIDTVSQDLSRSSDSAVDLNEYRESAYEPSYKQVCPKNFKVVFALYESDFLYEEQYIDHYSWNASSYYFDMGAAWIVLALALVVALVAIILPFIKKLETGWEKLFSMPLEVILILMSCGIAGAAGMFMGMSHTTLTGLQMISAERPINFIGSSLTAETLYGILLVLNFLGWAVLFFIEYVVVASLRQFFCGPSYYLKNRLLIVSILGWFKKPLKKMYKYVTDIDINDRLTSSIFKIVAVNFGILVILCSLWFFGIAGLLVYSIALFVLLRKYGEQLRNRFKSILNATNQMAEGNLKITMEEDLGFFQPLGKELEKVQQGFAKAVAEEAKSQNMKTELITNVSHDLKTPLTAIITYVDLLKKEGITEDERNAYIATIDQKSQRLKVLIEDLFEMSKANSGNIQMHFMDVDVVNLMKQVRLEMEEKIADSDLSFRWNLPEKHVMLSLDGQRTYRIFENLLNNILKYSLSHTRVYIDILDLGTEVQILFRNISAVELEDEGWHLTERFVRGDASRKTEGSGLGLAIVKSFVELQNGKLNIDVDGDLFKVSITWPRG